MKPEKKFMRLAINAAIKGIERGQTPFGACIVKDRQVIVSTYNAVIATIDITAHAEIQAIRKACQFLGSVDLSGCEMYSTSEPCPMCLMAAIWGKIDCIIYGTSSKDAQSVGFLGCSIPNNQMIQYSFRSIKLSGVFLLKECTELLTNLKQVVL